MNAAARQNHASANLATHDTKARQQRRASFAISLAGAFMLNAVAIGVFAAVVVHWRAPAGATQRTTWITALSIEPATPPEPVALQPSEQARSSEPPLQPTVQAPVPRPAIAAPAPAPPGADTGGAQTRFYKFREVDRAAQPDSDWNLDTATLDAAGIDTLAFEIFVDRDGAVVGCTVIEPATLRSDVREALERRLRQTVLQPALRGGVPVASMRRIEVSVLPPGQ